MSKQPSVWKGTIGKVAPFPKQPKVQLATLVDQVPESDEWLHETKFDGYRMLCQVRNGAVQFVSRNGNDWTEKFPTLAREAARLEIKTGILDGEVVILGPGGTTSYQALQNAFQGPRESPFVFYGFDVLYLNGRDLKQASIEVRKAILREIVPNRAKSTIKFSQHLIGNGKLHYADAARRKLEGLVSKRLGCPYLPGRGLDWLKVKCLKRDEFVIGGFTKPGGARQHFGALALGYYDPDGQLIYCGRVGTGFSIETLTSLYKQFRKLVQPESPFKNLAGHTGQAKDVVWLKPVLVAQIEFSNWTDGNQLRHPSFQGLREDKPARSVVRDAPLSGPLFRAATDTERSKNRSLGRLSRRLPPR